MTFIWHSSAALAKFTKIAKKVQHPVTQTYKPEQDEQAAHGIAIAGRVYEVEHRSLSIGYLAPI